MATNRMAYMAVSGFDKRLISQLSKPRFAPSCGRPFVIMLLNTSPMVSSGSTAGKKNTERNTVFPWRLLFKIIASIRLKDTMKITRRALYVTLNITVFKKRELLNTAR